MDDIGHHFPDTDEQWRGADSIELLREIVAAGRAEGWRVEHVDATVMLERPKLAPHREAMHGAAGEASAAGARKATTGERMGFVGREEGVAAMAVAPSEQPGPA